MSVITFNPLCPMLNAAVQTITAILMPGGFDIDTPDGPQAPDTFGKLKAWLGAGNKMLVSRHGLDGSIYDSREINAAFRAWHDYHHYHGGYDFSVDGERQTCARQVADIMARYGYGADSQRMMDILEADIIGQAQYYRIHKKFVENQRAFVEAYLTGNRDSVLLRPW